MELCVWYLFPGDNGHDYWKLDVPRYAQGVLGRGHRVMKSSCWHPVIGQRALWRGRSLLLCAGLNHLIFLQLMLWCILSGRSYIISADSMLGDWTGRSSRVRLRRWFFRHAAGFWVPGCASRAWLEKQGVPPDKIFEGCYTVDEKLIAAATGIAASSRATQRAAWWAGESHVVFLMVANLLPKRRCDHLLASCVRVAASHDDFRIVIVGAGEQLEVLQRKYEQTLDGKLVFTGPLAYADLARVYAAADVYVHSGGEKFSTAVQYAAIAGLPIISSRAVGACWDYVRAGENGLVVEDNESAEAWSEALARMLTVTEHERQRMGKNPRRLAEARGVDWATGQLTALVRQAWRQGYENRD